MSAPTMEGVKAFTDALPVPAQRALYMTQLMAATITAALRHGWTPEQLAKECGRDLDGVSNAGAVVQHRLKHCAASPPPKPTLDRKFRQPKPWCGKCSDQYARWAEDPETGLPVGRCSCWTYPPREGRFQ